MSSGRYSRQSTIVDQDKIGKQHALIVGVGAVGTMVADMIVRNGVPIVSIIDYDKVEEHNCSTQGFVESDIDKHKVEVLAEKLLAINSDVQVNHVVDCWRPGIERNLREEYGDFDVIFSCVDKFDIRELIYNYYIENKIFPVLFDARLEGEAMQLFSVYDDASKYHYSQSFYDDEEVAEGGCHIPMIKHSSTIAAGMLTQQYMSYLKHGDAFLYPHRTFTLLDGALYQNELKKQPKTKKKKD